MKLKKVLENIPGDKSVTHRAVMFGSIANGTSEIETRVLGRDNFATIRIFQQLGVDIRLSLTPHMFEMAKSENVKNCELVADSDTCKIYVEGKGIHALTKSEEVLDCGNSGTTARLLLGILASTKFSSTLVGDHSLSKRPFKRVTEPLSKMSANFDSEVLPLTIEGGDLEGIEYTLDKPSAQVKSAILLAGLFAAGETRVTEAVLSRDHTERMLEAMGVALHKTETKSGFTVSVDGDYSRKLDPLKLEVPGDISASMFYVVTALLGSEDVLIKGVGVNDTRKRCLDMLIEKGADIAFENERVVACEPVADLLVKPSCLRPLNLDKEEVAKMVDEVPILSVLASFIEGKSVIRGADELRVKESDRLAMTCAILKSYGVNFEEYPDGLDIYGSKDNKLEKNPALINGWKKTGDHRIEMCGAILEYLVCGEIGEIALEVVETSFPGFLDGFTRE
jgi:3-phosphoshikimate 1-carboxyvinyltransferase